MRQLRILSFERVQLKRPPPVFSPFITLMQTSGDVSSEQKQALISDLITSNYTDSADFLLRELSLVDDRLNGEMMIYCIANCYSEIAQNILWQ